MYLSSWWEWVQAILDPTLISACYDNTCNHRLLNLSLTKKIPQQFGTNPLWNLHLSGFLIHAFQTHVVGHCSQCRKMSIGSGCFSDFMAKRNSHTRHGYAIRQLQTELNTNKSQDIHSKKVLLCGRAPAGMCTLLQVVRYWGSFLLPSVIACS